MLAILLLDGVRWAVNWLEGKPALMLMALATDAARSLGCSRHRQKGSLGAPPWLRDKSVGAGSSRAIVCMASYKDIAAS